VKETEGGKVRRLEGWKIQVARDQELPTFLRSDFLIFFKKPEVLQ